MKRFKCIILCLMSVVAALAFSSMTATALEDDETEIIPSTPIVSPKGDVTLDGKLDITDATMIQKYCASIITFSSAQKNLADIDKSGAIDIADATYIQKKISGLIADDSDKKDDVIELPIIPVVR
ncbi:dockerin type I repeat-containing protein [uncultured Ruminococcus sp.]|uniref:dockerin type I repeat-containing protein n=1 Tax=uncultured Ruminococcus sp. TaxID=165186 RepID=UPI0025FFE194|nr:dockerin type I repeat-containing protein [uncultured Ruminococcus sp.]